jgi:hypothetical protein
MQRSSSKLLVMLLTLAVFFSSVAATPAENKSLILNEVRHVPGAGIVLLFDSTGLTYNDIQGGTAFVHSNSYNMYCNFKDETDVVRCIIPGSLTRYAGETFRAKLAGFLFWPKIPAPKSGPLVCSDQESLWYTVYIYEDGVFVESEEMPAEIYEWWLEIIPQFPEFNGITLEIADRYCGAKVIFEPLN